MAVIAQAQPQVTWLEQRQDMGVILEKNGKVNSTFRLVNTGSQPLLIVKTQVGCGCTAISYPQQAIAPGDTAAVTLTYNPSGRPGQFSKQALIFTNTTPKRSVLEITGNVIPTDATLDKQYPVKAGPLRITQQLMPMGELTRGQNKTTYLSAYNASTDTLLVHVQGAQPHISPAIVPDTVAPGRVTALTVHYRSAQAPLWGLNVDTLTLACEPIRHSSGTPSWKASINVMAQVLEDFGNMTDEQLKRAPVMWTGLNESLDFGSMTRGKIVSNSFQVTNHGKDPLIIRRLWTPVEHGITVSTDKLEVKHGKSATVTITVDTSLVEGELLNAPLTLMTNDPDKPRVTVRLVGIIDKH